MKPQTKYKISGHETFPLRYTWLPKAVKVLKNNPKIFSDEDDAMVSLGVGKNMVRAIRFWSEAAGIIKFQGKDGLDPYLEDIQTLWLIHWKLSTQVLEPLFARDYLLNQRQEPDLIRTAVFTKRFGRVTARNTTVGVDCQQHSRIEYRSLCCQEASRQRDAS